MKPLEELRKYVYTSSSQLLLTSLPLLFRTVEGRAENLPSGTLDLRGFTTELGVSSEQTSIAFARELSLYAHEDGGPGPLARLVKALRLSLKSDGAILRGTKHAGIHLKSMFNADRAVFMERMLDAANKGTHSVLLIADDAAEALAAKGVDKLDELSRTMAGQKLDDIPFNRAMHLDGGSTVTRGEFWGSADKFTVSIPASELGVTREMVSIFDAKAYKKAVEAAQRAGDDPKLIDPSSYCEPAKKVDNLTYVFFGELSTGSKLVNGLLTMFPNAQRLAIGTAVLTASTGKVKAETATLGETTVARRVEELTAEHLAQFAAGAGLGEKIDVTSTWDKVTDAGAEIGMSVALDWGLIEAFGARLGGLLGFLLMPVEANKGEGATLAWMREQHARSLMRENMDAIADAMTNDIVDRAAEELERGGYKDACAFGDRVRKNVRAAVVENLSILLAE
jgi:hypothetical protein